MFRITSSSDRCRPWATELNTPAPISCSPAAPSFGATQYRVCQALSGPWGHTRSEVLRDGAAEGPSRVLGACHPRAHAGRKDRWLAHRDMLPACPFLSRCMLVPRSGPFAELRKFSLLCSVTRTHCSRSFQQQSVLPPDPQATAQLLCPHDCALSRGCMMREPRWPWSGAGSPGAVQWVPQSSWRLVLRCAGPSFITSPQSTACEGKGGPLPECCDLALRSLTFQVIGGAMSPRLVL